jgi:hypothetical protein
LSPQPKLIERNESAADLQKILQITVGNYNSV